VSQQINLFNPDFQERKKLFGAAAMAQALLLLFVGVLVLSWYAGRSVTALQKQADTGASQLKTKKRQLATVNAEFAPRDKSAGLETQLAEAEAQLAALKRIASVIDRGELGNATGYSEYFRALARQHVDGLWLTGLAITGAGCDIGVRGRALDASLLPGFLGRLTKEKIMQGKAFGSLQISQPGEGGDKTVKAKAPPGTPASFVEFSLQSRPEGAQS
jgi:hypothetical protein